MNADIFAEWLRRQGYRVVHTKSSYWYNQGPRVFQAFPYHWLISPEESEIVNCIDEHKILALRYSTEICSNEGAISYHAVFESPRYDIDILGKWGRKNVRKGLSKCDVIPITFDRLADEGWELQRDTLDRQGRRLNLDKNTWSIRCLSAKDLPGFDAWGAVVDGILAASVITYQINDWVYMLYQQCRRDFLPAHVNNALGFVVTQNLLSRNGVHSILYGLHSLDAPPSVDEFKFRMGYTAKPVRQRVVFNPYVKPFLNQSTLKFARGFQRILPGNPTISKAEGMLRFYIDGKRNLSDQSWPEPIMDQKEVILGGR